MRRVSLLLVWLVTFAGTVNWDPGLQKRCAWTLHPQHKATFYADYTDCNPGAAESIPDAPFSIPHYILGVNSPTPNWRCGPVNQAYKVNGRKSPVRLAWIKSSDGSYTIDMSIRGDPCANKGEISFAIGEYNQTPIAGLVTYDEMRVRERKGICHAAQGLHMRDGRRRYNLGLAFRPNSTNDPRYNHPRPGVLFFGSPSPRERLIILDAEYFGYPDLCPHERCVWTAVKVTWEPLFDFVKAQGWWRSLEKNSTKVNFAMGIQTFDRGSRMRVEHRNLIITAPDS